MYLHPKNTQIKGGLPWSPMATGINPVFDSVLTWFEYHNLTPP